MLGGSVALAARRAGIARRIIGFDPSSEHLAIAIERAAIDQGYEVLDDALMEPDLVVLAAPVGVLCANAALVASLTRGAITDVGSAKRKVVAAFSSTSASRRFIGSHPLAGSEKSGPHHSDGALFADKVCALTPTASTPDDLCELASWFWTALGAVVLEMTAEEHDFAVAYSSHMPHLAAVAVALAAARHPNALVGAGLVGATRQATSGPGIWKSILEQNGDAVVGALDELIAVLAGIRTHIASGDAAAIESTLSAAAKRRAEIMERRRSPATWNPAASTRNQTNETS